MELIMDAEKRIKMHIGELTVTIHALQAKIEELEARIKELSQPAQKAE